MAILIPLLVEQKECSSMPHHLYNRNHVKNLCIHSFGRFFFVKEENKVFLPCYKCVN